MYAVHIYPTSEAPRALVLPRQDALQVAVSAAERGAFVELEGYCRYGYALCLCRSGDNIRIAVKAPRRRRWILDKMPALEAPTFEALDLAEHYLARLEAYQVASGG